MIALNADYIFLFSGALLLLGSILIRFSSSKNLQFIYNQLLLMALIGSLLFEIYSSQTHVLLSIISINPFSLFFALLFTSGLFIVNLLAFAFSERYSDFALLSNFALLGMYLVAFSASMLTIFVGLELTSVPMVFAILLSRKSTEAATKFFIMASIAIALLSFAIVLFYGGSGNISFTQAAKSQLLLLASVLFIVSLGVESSVFPFNLLMPDVYQGSPAYVTSFLGGLGKKVGFAALIQVMILCFVAYHSAFEVIAILSVITMFYGNIVAMVQTNLKRMLAYSSISQSGYILIGLATATQAGISASLFQIFSHVFAFIGILGVVAWLEARNRTRIEDLNGLSSENRLVAFSLTFFMLTFIGIPSTSGFIGKFLLFFSAINSGLLLLAILGIINSVISIYYYSKAILAAFTGKPKFRKVSTGASLALALVLVLLITFIVGIYPQPLINLTNHAGAFLFGTAS